MPNAADRIAGFVLERLPEEPIRRRIPMLRDLAAFAPSNARRRTLIAMADELQDIEERHHQLLLDFKRRAGR